MKKTNRCAVYLVCLMMLASTLACNLPVAGEPTQDPRLSRILHVAVFASYLADSYHVVVDYSMNPDDSKFQITCLVPNENGTMHDYGSILFSTGDTYTDFYITVKKPGTYMVECSDGNHAEDGSFTVEQRVTITGETPVPATPPAGSFKMPKPGDFSSAGMWMYFDKGSSDVAGYSVPQQCLPGVNYSHVGGKSKFEINPDGEMTGWCSLSYYDGKTRLSGNLTGSWDGEADKITFHLETKTESDVEWKGMTGLVVNKTTYDGDATFNSAIQVSGTATWHTECTTTNSSVAGCYKDSYMSGLTANGTVPFVINFNAR